MDWRELAACQGHDPELFFPISEVGEAGAAAEAPAKAVCAVCPVLTDCRDWAMDVQAYGIAGGMTAEERRAERRRRGRSLSPAAGYDTGYRQPPKAPGRSHKKQAAA